MPKMKTHKGTAKRFRLTGSGKIVRRRSNKGHILEKKSPKRKRKLGQKTLVDVADTKRIKKLLVSK
ncbi:50S ribosomal protein L35 [Candidatus Oleimmundimicrobium sp.]|uniref:50S ribosomal protein L35 n=1 Tax=Candidatus Oleimmundimicrobium sp. TaxID=3060597 RepID=UPI00271FAB8C|nr:50S ribosomal protein L35 [Candidatus Oleimmundimicrobium sp.]MDO8885549.1 50S ribosomal protein L35 [Candidatus Oleimmundimicrobium sp.]